MSTLTLDGIALPVLSMGIVQRPAYRSTSRSGRVRRYTTGAQRESYACSLGPFTPGQAAWLLARLQDADTWPLTADEWSGAGIPSGLLIALAANPLGAHAAFLAGSTPLPGNLSPLSCSYWYSSDGSAWGYVVQGEVAHGTPRIVGGVMAPGYYAGLTVVPAVLPAAWVPQLAAAAPSSSRVALAGDSVEPGLFEAQISAAPLAVNRSVTIEVTFHPR